MDECPGLFLEHSGGIAGKMWHEARKQERKIREVMINYQKRAERRREHYEKMRVNPNQFLRLYGSKCQMHIDPSGGNRDSTMIPWQGDSSNMISRYDVRIHLDYIPDDSKLPKHELTAEEKKEEAKCNYERYRSLVQHSFRGLGEKEALAQIDVEEMYPDNRKKGKEKKKSQAKAAIAYSYQEEEEEAVDEEEQARRDEELLAAYLGEEVEEEKAFSSESEYEIDMDVDELGTSQVDKLNVLALDFGVPAGAFSRTLRTEKAQLEEQKQARLADLEKSTLSGKKARRERRLLKEKRVNPRMPTPPTYARRGSPTYEPYEGEGEPRSGSSSRSPSPEVGRVEYITEFGGGSSDPPNKKEPTSLKETKPRIPQHPSPSHSHSSHPHQHSYHRRPRSRSRSRDRSHHHHRHSERSRSRSRSRSRGRSRERRHRRRSSSRSRERYHYSRRSRSRSHSPKPHMHRSRSHSRSRSRSHSPHEKRNSSSEKNKPSSAPATTPRASKPKEKPKLTPQERLKKKMQAQLSKQFKQDKKVQREKEEQKEAQRVEREEELRDQMMRLREKEKSQWEKEHEERELHRRHSRSRSRSPHGYHYSSHDYYSY